MALALQYEERFENRCSELVDLGSNEVFYLKYPTRNVNNNTVMKVLFERKARSLQAVIAYSVFLLFDKDATYDDPTQWDVNAFKKWRKASCSTFIAGRMQYEKSREEFRIIYQENAKRDEKIRTTEDILKEE